MGRRREVFRGELVAGTDEAWTQLNSLAGDVDTPNQTESNAAYQRLLGNRPDGTDDPALETLLDVENMIDYMILNIYGGNWDWSRNNWYAGRLRGPSSTGFQYYSWDAEYALGIGSDRLGHSDLEIDKTGEFEDVANVYDKLRANDEIPLVVRGPRCIDTSLMAARSTLIRTIPTGTLPTPGEMFPPLVTRSWRKPCLCR